MPASYNTATADIAGWLAIKVTASDLAGEQHHVELTCTEHNHPSSESRLSLASRAQCMQIAYGRCSWALVSWPQSITISSQSSEPRGQSNLACKPFQRKASDFTPSHTSHVEHLHVDLMFWKLTLITNLQCSGLSCSNDKVCLPCLYGPAPVL